jgi:hypothetical protein
MQYAVGNVPCQEKKDVYILPTPRYQGSMSDTHLVLGLAAGLHYADVRPFARSLQVSNDLSEEPCSCVLFVTPTTTGVERVQEHGIKTITFERPPEFSHVPYNAWRYFLYREYLERHKADSAESRCWVLCCDVRDLVFQRPFHAFPWGEGLNVTLEDQRMCIGQCPYMVRWLTHHLGPERLPEILERHGHEAISCSGSTVARPGVMLDYLDKLCERLLPCSPAPGTAGYDQAVHNLLLCEGALGVVFRHDNAGPILTLGYKETPPELGQEGDVLNDAGVPAHVVHQYDRLPWLHGYLRERWR